MDGAFMRHLKPPRNLPDTQQNNTSKRGKASRRKGAQSERDLLKQLGADLGLTLTRNLTQTRGGGEDCDQIPGWAIEVKRQEREALAAWWQQAADQALRANKRAILFYRASRQPWRACVDLHDLAPETFPVRYRDFAIMSYDAAAQLIRESLPRNCEQGYEDVERRMANGEYAE